MRGMQAKKLAGRGGRLPAISSRAYCQKLAQSRSESLRWQTATRPPVCSSETAAHGPVRNDGFSTVGRESGNEALDRLNGRNWADSRRPAFGVRTARADVLGQTRQLQHGA